MNGLESIDVVRCRVESIKANPSHSLHSFFVAQAKANKVQLGSVYILKKRNTDIYKIGVSIHPWQRIKEIQRTCKRKIDPVFAAEVDRPYRLESELHSLFNTKRLNREWFLLPDCDVIQAIDTIRRDQSKH